MSIDDAIRKTVAGRKARMSKTARAIAGVTEKRPAKTVGPLSRRTTVGTVCDRLGYDPPKRKKVAPVKAPKKPDKPGAPTTPGPFVRNVLRDVKAMGPEGRFGSRKVFISEAHKAYRRRRGSRNLHEFKELLVTANRLGQLKLTRADLVSAMDPRKVAESETSYLTATFHFIEDPSRS